MPLEQKNYVSFYNKTLTQNQYEYLCEEHENPKMNFPAMEWGSIGKQDMATGP